MLKTTELKLDGPARIKGAFDWAGVPGERPGDMHAFSAGRLEADRFRGGVFIPVGSGNENGTFNYRLWLVDAFGPPHRSRVLPALLGFGTATLSALEGAGEVDDGLRYADTLTWTLATGETTPDGPGSLLLAGATALEVSVWSPGDDTPARLIVPDMGGGWAVAFEVSGAGPEGAWLGRLFR